MLEVEVRVLRQGRGDRVTQAEFTFVAVDEAGRKRAISRALGPAPGPGAAPPD
jgi:acyl-CoA hydrolase